MNFEPVESAAAWVASQPNYVPPAMGIILGSGLGAFADQMDAALRLPYASIPHFPKAHVEGHKGELVLGCFKGVPLAVMSGRVHYYEGHKQDDVVLPMRVLAQLGAKKVVLTNAAGSLNPSFVPGELMVIADHINFTGTNPLCGPNDTRLGARFVDMTQAYSALGQAAWHSAAATVGLTLRSGTYLGVSGPSYETPAEVRMMHRLGGDAVGMSTVGEVVAARHCGLEVAGLSIITNTGAGLSAGELSHADVTFVAQRVRTKLISLLGEMVVRWS